MQIKVNKIGESKMKWDMGYIIYINTLHKIILSVYMIADLVSR